MIKYLGWSIVIASIGAPIAMRDELSAGYRLLFSTIILLYSLKVHILLKSYAAGTSLYSKFGLLIYCTVWPGIDPAPFMQKHQPLPNAGKAILHGTVCMGLGLISLLVTAVKANSLSNEAFAGLIIISLLITIHFGFSHILTGVMWKLGWNVKPLFVNPFAGTSLRDFWSNRWNLAFVEMNHLIFLPLCRTVLSARFSAMGVFVISGLLHEYALSFPGHGCYGGPLLYFLMHGLLVSLESTSFKPSEWPPLITKIWVYGWILAPLPLLFHPCFQSRIIVPFGFYLHRVLGA